MEIIDSLEEHEFSVLHTDSAAAQGLVTLAAARLCTCRRRDVNRAG